MFERQQLAYRTFDRHNMLFNERYLHEIVTIAFMCM